MFISLSLDSHKELDKEKNTKMIITLVIYCCVHSCFLVDIHVNLITIHLHMLTVAILTENLKLINTIHYGQYISIYTETEDYPL